MSIRNIAILTALAALIPVPGLLAHDDVKDLRLVRDPPREASPAPPRPELSVEVTTDRGGDGVVYIGDSVTFRASVSRAAHLTLVEVATSGRVNRIVPDDGERGDWLAAGVRYAVPGRGHFAVEGPIGEETVIAIATDHPLPWIEDLFPALRGGSDRPAPAYGRMEVATTRKDLVYVPEETASGTDTVETFCRQVAGRVRGRCGGDVAFAVTRFRVR